MKEFRGPTLLLLQQTFLCLHLNSWTAVKSLAEKIATHFTRVSRFLEDLEGKAHNNCQYEAFVNMSFKAFKTRQTFAIRICI